jgi:hypothetical protein
VEDVIMGKSTENTSETVDVWKNIETADDILLEMLIEDLAKTAESANQREETDCERPSVVLGDPIKVPNSWPRIKWPMAPDAGALALWRPLTMGAENDNEVLCLTTIPTTSTSTKHDLQTPAEFLRTMWESEAHDDISALVNSNLAKGEELNVPKFAPNKCNTVDPVVGRDEFQRVSNRLCGS